MEQEGMGAAGES
jgi:hypothetical protein